MSTVAATPLAFVDLGLGNSSYLVDLGDGRALVIDPVRHPAGYLAEARRRGLRIVYVAETHLHADFVSGARELAALDAELLVPAAGGHEFPVRGLHHGDEVDLGGLTLRPLATPGHTPEHLAYLLLDGPSPIALFSGGSLLVDSVARTDLIAPDQTEPLARSLWRSLQERVLTLPDDLPVYPTHGAGSFCAAPATGERTTTIGRERRANPLLAAPDEDAFVRQLLDGLGTYPPYFLRLRAVNRHGPEVYGPDEPTLPHLSPSAVRRLLAAGVWIVDARPVTAFSTAHIPGSVSIALRPQFASWLGWLVPPDQPLVVVVDREQDVGELVHQARGIGYECLSGALAGGIEAWTNAGGAVASIPLVPPSGLHERVLDVRQDGEYAGGHIPGSLHFELGALKGADIPAGHLVVACGHGERAMTGASLLARRGRRDIAVLDGGPADWASVTGSPLTTR